MIIVMLSGLILSVSFKSSHSPVMVMLIVSCVWVFVTVVVPSSFVMIWLVYSSVKFTSSSVYMISFASFILRKSVNVYVQPISSPINTICPVLSPFAYNSTTICAGRLPSWLLLSFQTLLTVRLTVSGLWISITVKLVPFCIIVLLYSSCMSICSIV